MSDEPNEGHLGPGAGVALSCAALGGLAPLGDRLSGLDDQLAKFSNSTDRAIMIAARKLRRQIREFEPSITMIGQVKAGKTTLVNALVGWQDLLPADVNPWTSVVTSLHLSPHMSADERRSAFRFFSNEEWDHLIRQGGRVGELAARAGAEDEVEKVRRQLEAMRQKSEQRLGRKFHMLLGQSHDYDSFDEGLIQRYVCLGDDFWEEADGSTHQGRFADITRTADLWFARPMLPFGLCIQDTPGVNDTFMIREQVTLNALRGSRLCVVVLSAQQALSSVDLGLIRLISNVKSRDIIIFVNRVDELADPGREVPEIRASIEATLKKFDGPKNAEVFFGSGYWAGLAAAGECDDMRGDSADALLAWAEAQIHQVPDNTPANEAIWILSGIPALCSAIAGRIEGGVGEKLVSRIENALENLQTSASALTAANKAEAVGGARSQLDRDTLDARFAQIQANALEMLEIGIVQAEQTFLSRVENARQTFLNRATGSLLKHLDSYGEGVVWSYDPAGLRMLLRSAYQVFGRAVQKAGTQSVEQAAREIGAVYAEAFGLAGQDGQLSAPPMPNVSPPVALGQTIALDLRGSWWTRFWRRKRGYGAFADDFSRLIYEETLPVVNALKQDNADPFAEAVRAVLKEFLETQRDLVLGLSGGGDASGQTNGRLSAAG